MPKRLTVEGKSYTFPDDTTTEELNEFLSTLESPMPEAPAPSQHPHARTWEMAKDLFQSVDQGLTPETLTDPETFPTTGGMVGGVVGGMVGGAPGAIGGATLGGAIGAGGRDAIYSFQGDERAPEDFPTALTDAAEEGAWQGGFQTLGGIPGAALNKVGGALTRWAPRAVRSGLKFSKPDLMKRAAIEGRTPEEVAERQAQHILDKRLTSAEKAEQRVSDLGSQIDTDVAAFEAATPGAAVDFDTRAPKYLSDFLKKLEDNQLLPDQDMEAVQAVGPRLMKSPLTRAATPASSDIRPIEKPIQEALEELRNAGKATPIADEGLYQATGAGGSFPPSGTNRVLREDISPSEMLRRVRGKSFYDPNVSEGTIMGGKVIERAGRDSVKERVPGVASLLEDQGLSIDAVRDLTNYAMREGSADQLRQGAMHSLANRNMLTAALLQLQKTGQFRGGMAAGARGPQIQRLATSRAVDPQVVSNVLRALMASHGQDE